MTNDLISRKALLEKECCGRISSNDVRNAPAVDVAPNGNQAGWISVDDRLPETEEWVAVWYRDKDGDYFPTVGRYAKVPSGKMCWATDVDNNELAYPPEKITHWMPLPKPPITNEQSRV